MIGAPTASFVLLAYNQQRFIQEAIRGALVQAYSPLEVVFSDDCSSDHTFEIMRESVQAYPGPHRVVLNRNRSNLGFAAHINRAMELATGDVIVIAAGDDVSLPGRVASLMAYLSGHPECDSVHSNVISVDESGVEKGPWFHAGRRPDPACAADIAAGNGVLGASHAWRRQVFERFGALDSRIIREDAAIPFRAALIGTIGYVDEVLVRYRRHAANMYKYRDLMASAAELHADWRFHAEADLVLLATMRSDLGRLEQDPPGGQSLAAIRSILEARALRASYEVSWVRAGSWPRKLAVGRAAFAQGVPARAILRWMAMQWLPRLYLARLRSDVRQRRRLPGSHPPSRFSRPEGRTG